MELTVLLDVRYHFVCRLYVCISVRIKILLGANSSQAADGQTCVRAFHCVDDASI